MCLAEGRGVPLAQPPVDEQMVEASDEVQSEEEGKAELDRHEEHHEESRHGKEFVSMVTVSQQRRVDRTPDSSAQILC